MLKKIPSDKVNVTHNAFFFLSRTPTHHSFTFNSLFLYELSIRFVPLKVCARDFPFSTPFVLTKVYFSVQQKSMDSLLLERQNSLQN